MAVIIYQQMNIEIAVEVFFNYMSPQKGYFINQYIYEDTEYNDVILDQDWGILLGEDINKILYNQVYKDFVNNKWQKSNYFHSEQMREGQVFRVKYQDNLWHDRFQPYYFGLSYN